MRQSSRRADVHESTRSCPVCGYDLRGIEFEQTKSRCPECGQDLVLVMAGDVFEPPIRRAAVQVTLPPALSLVILVLMIWLEIRHQTGAFTVISLALPAIAVMGSAIVFFVHATRLNLAPRSLYVVRLFLIAAAVNAAAIACHVLVFVGTLMYGMP